MFRGCGAGAPRLAPSSTRRVPPVARDPMDSLPAPRAVAAGGAGPSRRSVWQAGPQKAPSAREGRRAAGRAGSGPRALLRAHFPSLRLASAPGREADWGVRPVASHRRSVPTRPPPGPLMSIVLPPLLSATRWRPRGQNNNNAPNRPRGNSALSVPPSRSGRRAGTCTWRGQGR